MLPTHIIQLALPPVHIGEQVRWFIDALELNLSAALTLFCCGN